MGEKEGEEVAYLGLFFLIMTAFYLRAAPSYL